MDNPTNKEVVLTAAWVNFMFFLPYTDWPVAVLDRNSLLAGKKIKLCGASIYVMWINPVEPELCMELQIRALYRNDKHKIWICPIDEVGSSTYISQW